VLVSGKEGKFLQKVATPHGEETYYAPQVLVHQDGVSIVVFGTGGQASPGGLYAVPLYQLVKGNMLHVRLIMFLIIFLFPSHSFFCENCEIESYHKCPLPVGEYFMLYFGGLGYHIKNHSFNMFFQFIKYKVCYGKMCNPLLFMTSMRL